VVGSGSAGGTVAARLSEDPACTVVLVEAGPDFPQEAERSPGFYTGGALRGERGAGGGAPIPQLDWAYLSEALPNGRRIALTRGRLMGGSSMVNGCVAVRARPSDFDGWVAAGADGWTWETVLPYYEVVERELSVRTYPRERWLPVQELYAEAAQEIGMRWHDDINAPDAWDGVVGPWPRNRRNEVRQGSLNTYVRQARPRENFAIVADALVDRVLLDGTRATGIRYVDAAGAAHELHADRVILSAGAYGSPPILLRSGIGPADELRALGIEAVVDLPVGRGLLDHPGIAMHVDVEPRFAMLGWPEYSVVGRGASYWSIPTAIDESGTVAFAFFLGLLEGIHGSIALRSAAPDDPPVIDHGYWPLVETGAFERPWEDFNALLRTRALRAAGGRDARAGVGLRERLLDAVASGSHPAGGCAIGRVVSPDLEVLGVDGLTVADASVFPRHVTNNPNLTVHVVGELAAAKLRATAAPALEGSCASAT
jgi:choline dehydrogenase